MSENRMRRLRSTAKFFSNVTYFLEADYLETFQPGLTKYYTFHVLGGVTIFRLL